MNKFHGWLKKRDNIVTGRTSLDEDAIVEIIDPISLGLGAAGLGAAAYQAFNPRSTTRRTLRKWTSDPRSTWNKDSPITPQDAHNKVQTDGTVDNFAVNLGLGSVPVGPLQNALINIAVARIYGKDFGWVEEADLAQVWTALQRRINKKPDAPTLAQAHGVTRPFAIVGKVPGQNSGKKYGITQDAVDYDKEVVTQMRNQPTAATPSAAPPSPSGTAPASAPSALTPEQQKVVDSLGLSSHSASQVITILQGLRTSIPPKGPGSAKTKMILNSIIRALGGTP